MPIVCSRRIATIVLVCAAALAGALPARAQSTAPDTATIRGVVLDRADGSPIADVAVRLQDGRVTVKTDDTGRFELAGVAPGHHIVYVSLVGFLLVKRPVEVAAGATLDLTIALSEGTGTYSETVNVAGERFREQEKSVPAQQTLGSAEIQNLRNLLTNDPMRAIQVLPGVTTGDDFRSEFAVRGSPFSRMNFTFDGIPTSFLLHTVQQVQDGGSIAMVNGDILDGITLLNGSYPQRYGNRLGAELDFHMREGSRDRTQTRVGVSGTDASIVVEGPLGHAKAGSWLVSARKSYLELLLKQIQGEGDDNFGFGFSDVQSKLVYDLSPRHHVELSLVAGRSRLDQTSTLNQVNPVDDGRNHAVLVNGAWRFTASPRFVITQRLAVATQQFTNLNVTGVELGSGSAREITGRTDFVATATGSLTFEGGGQIQAQHREEIGRQLASNPGIPPFVTISNGGDAQLSSAYAQARWAKGSRLTVAAGGRVDHWSLTRDTAASPWAQADLRLTGTVKLRAGAGIYRQFPDFPEATGQHGNPALNPERAYHADAGVEQTLGSSARWQLTFYNREERDVVRQPESELRLVNGRLARVSLTAPWINAMDGYARGVELLVQRRSNSGLSGWLSYSYGVNRYHDRTTGETFDGDFDQRHTFNAYGLYRLTNRFSLAGKLRIGSNTPAIGYWEHRDGAEYVSSVRNELRLPVYSRLDVRANRTFNWERKRLTLFVEVMNVLGRENMRYEQPGVNIVTLQAFGIFNSMIPRIPSAGILIEF
jgi:outer membrane receptor protein involved in Fe transport